MNLWIYFGGTVIFSRNSWRKKLVLAILRDEEKITGGMRDEEKIAGGMRDGGPPLGGLFIIYIFSIILSHIPRLQ